jgi:chromosome segregation ATPase
MEDTHVPADAAAVAAEIKTVTVHTIDAASASNVEEAQNTRPSASSGLHGPATSSSLADGVTQRLQTSTNAHPTTVATQHASATPAFDLPPNQYAVLTKEDLHNGPGPESLPAELQHASRDQTVCDYCGVSYLIFSEVQSLQRQLASSKAELEAWRSKIDQHDALQHQLDAARREAESERQRASEMQAQLFEKDAETSKLIREAEERMQASSDSRGSEAAMQLDLTRRLRAEARVSHLELQLHQLQGSFARIRDQLQATRESFSAHSNTLREELKCIAAEQSSAIVQCSLELRGHREKIGHMESEKEELKRQLAAAESTQLEHERNGLERESAFERERHAYAIQLEKAAAQAQQYVSDCSKLEAQLSSKDTQLLASERELDSLRIQLAGVNNQLADATQNSNNLNQRVQQLQQEINEAATTHDSVNTATAMKFAEFQELLTRYDEAVKTAERQNLSDNERIRTLESALADRDSHTALLRSQASGFKEHSAKQQQGLLEETQRRQTAEAAYNQLQMEYLQLMRDRDGIVTQLEDASMQNQQLLDSITVAQADLESCKQQLLATGEQRDNAVFDMATLRGEHNALLSSKLLLDKELEMLLEQQARASVSHATPEAAQELSRLQQEAAAYRMHQHELEQKIDQMEAVIHQECAERTFLTDEVNRLRKKSALPALTTEEVTSSTKAYFDNIGTPGSISGAGAPAEEISAAPAKVHLPRLPARNTPTPAAEPESAAYRAAQSRASSQAASSSGRPIQGMSAKYATRR